jgi:hypothetical protein
MGQDGARRDFFISYTQADRAWAEWIAWQLEEARYTTVLQAWDFAPGRALGGVRRRFACGGLPERELGGCHLAGLHGCCPTC